MNSHEAPTLPESILDRLFLARIQHVSSRFEEDSNPEFSKIRICKGLGVLGCRHILASTFCQLLHHRHTGGDAVIAKTGGLGKDPNLHRGNHSDRKRDQHR